MTETEFELDDENVLKFDYSDEALEATVGPIIAGNYTLGMCTGVTDCPGSRSTI